MNETILNYIKNTQINDTNSESLFKVSVGDMLCKKYKVTEKLSVSSSGEADIFKVSSIENNTELVVKIYRRKNSVKKNVINIISSINNKNVSKIIEFGEINGHSYIVLPFYKNGSFETFIKKGFKLDKKILNQS